MKNFFKNEWAKLREMNFRDKRQYIWEYYKLHLFALLILAFIAGSIINAIINPSKDEYLYIAWIGIPVHPHTLAEMRESLSIIVENPERQEVWISDYSMTDNPQINMAMQTRFVGMLRLGGLDVFMTNREGMEELVSEGFVKPIQGVLSAMAINHPAMYRDMGERLFTIYHDIPEAHIFGTNIMAISLAGSPFAEYYGIDSNDLYIAMVAGTSRYEAIAKALEVFLNGA